MRLLLLAAALLPLARAQTATPPNQDSAPALEAGQEKAKTVASDAQKKLATKKKKTLCETRGAFLEAFQTNHASLSFVFKPLYQKVSQSLDGFVQKRCLPVVKKEAALDAFLDEAEQFCDDRCGVETDRAVASHPLSAPKAGIIRGDCQSVCTWARLAYAAAAQP